jgi:hypothetical protein
MRDELAAAQIPITRQFPLSALRLPLASNQSGGNVPDYISI